MMRLGYTTPAGMLACVWWLAGVGGAGMLRHIQRPLGIRYSCGCLPEYYRTLYVIVWQVDELLDRALDHLTGSSKALAGGTDDGVFMTLRQWRWESAHGKGRTRLPVHGQTDVRMMHV